MTLLNHMARAPQASWIRHCAGVLLLFGAASFFTPEARANDITGIWATGSEGGQVRIYRCGTALCGKIVDAARLRTNPDLRDLRNSDPAKRTRRVKGLVVLQGFTGGPREWEGGPIYDPETGNGAKHGTLKLLPGGKLEVKGCLGPFCRTKIWSPVR